MYPPEYQHLLDFLDSNPEYLQDMRTRLLMPDLVALPEQFAQLVGLMTDLTAPASKFLPKPPTAGWIHWKAMPQRRTAASRP